MITEANVWVDELGTEQCWRLLERCAVGRLGFAAEGEQLILPVNYVVDGHCIVVRTGRSVLLEALGPGATVAFEVDGADAVSETGWSVLIKGHASEMDPPGTQGAAAPDAAAVGVGPTRPLAVHHAVVRHRPGHQSRPPSAARPRRVAAGGVAPPPRSGSLEGGSRCSRRSSSPSTSNPTVTARCRSRQRWRASPRSRSSSSASRHHTCPTCPTASSSKRAHAAAAGRWSVDVLHDNDVVAALAAFIADRPGALVLMATRARSAIGQRLLGSVTEGLLGRLSQPMLLVGPHVVVSTHWTDPDHTHRRSVARRLTHRSHHPVLVVPARRDPVAPADVPPI